MLAILTSRKTEMSNPYQRIAEKLNIREAVTEASKRNDLIPPRPEDKVSGELGKRFSEHLIRELERGDYDPMPAFSVAVPKSRLITRPAALLSFTDRVVYEAIVKVLRSRIERFLLGKYIVFWPRGCPSAKRGLDFENSVIKPEFGYIVRSDIVGFYESIDHERLADAVVNATGYRDIAEALMHFLERVMESRRGLPQGLTPSDTLATVYLAELDFAMVRNNFRYFRHGDDVRIAVENYDRACLAVRCLEAELRKLGLLLHNEKTRALHQTTYTDTVSSYQRRFKDAQNQLIDAEVQSLVKDKHALQKAMIDSGMEPLAWDFFTMRLLTWTT